MTMTPMTQEPIIEPVQPEQQELPVVMPERSHDPLYVVKLRPGLTPEEVEDARHIMRWLRHANGQSYGIAGIMLITGPPRAGKGLFGAWLSYKIKKYFAGIRVLTDERMGELFGDYTFFNDEILLNDIAIMNDIAGKDIVPEAKTAKQKEAMREMVTNWETEKGAAMFQRSVARMTEASKYLDKRRPGMMILMLMNQMLKMFGHTETLYLLDTQFVDDLDIYRCLPLVTHHAKCNWCRGREDTVQVSLHKVQWSRSKQQLVPAGSAIPIFVDGGKYRAELGGKRYYDLYQSKGAPRIKMGTTSEILNKEESEYKRQQREAGTGTT